MKHFLLTAVALIVILGGLSGCRKTPINGDLDGQWQIMKIDYKDSIDVVPGQLYYCFFLHTVNLTRVGGGTIGGNMDYNEGAKTIRLQFPYNKDGESLKPWGMKDWETMFKVEELTGKRLVLESDIALIELRKF